MKNFHTMLGEKELKRVSHWLDLPKVLDYKSDKLTDEAISILSEYMSEDANPENIIKYKMLIDIYHILDDLDKTNKDKLTFKKFILDDNTKDLLVVNLHFDKKLLEMIRDKFQSINKGIDHFFTWIDLPSFTLSINQLRYRVSPIFYSGYFHYEIIDYSRLRDSDIVEIIFLNDFIEVIGRSKHEELRYFADFKNILYEKVRGRYKYISRDDFILSNLYRFPEFLPLLEDYSNNFYSILKRENRNVDIYSIINKAENMEEFTVEHIFSDIIENKNKFKVDDFDTLKKLSLLENSLLDVMKKHNIKEDILPEDVENLYNYNGVIDVDRKFIFSVGNIYKDIKEIYGEDLKFKPLLDYICRLYEYQGIRKPIIRYKDYISSLKKYVKTRKEANVDTKVDLNMLYPLSIEAEINKLDFYGNEYQDFKDDLLSIIPDEMKKKIVKDRFVLDDYTFIKKDPSERDEFFKEIKNYESVIIKPDGLITYAVYYNFKGQDRLVGVLKVQLDYYSKLDNKDGYDLNVKAKIVTKTPQHKNMIKEKMFETINIGKINEGQYKYLKREPESFFIWGQDSNLSYFI